LCAFLFFALSFHGFYSRFARVVTVTEGSGVITPTTVGSLTSGSDKTEFSFDHTISGSRISGIQDDFLEYTIKSTNPENYVLHQKAWMILTIPVKGSTRTDMMDNGPNTVPADIGTVWKPLESEPAITIYLNSVLSHSLCE
jgi:hypothetical protein